MLSTATRSSRRSSAFCLSINAAWSSSTATGPSGPDARTPRNRSWSTPAPALAASDGSRLEAAPRTDRASRSTTRAALRRSSLDGADSATAATAERPWKRDVNIRPNTATASQRAYPSSLLTTISHAALGMRRRRHLRAMSKVTAGVLGRNGRITPRVIPGTHAAAKAGLKKTGVPNSCASARTHPATTFPIQGVTTSASAPGSSLPPTLRK
mmetsp:Transcript_6825/g.22737  ORF Transcript_6825/g.22737 Transcript_6825/m.22737 type:complete len:212 (-) Transcript_6825:132-767(-)